MNWRFLPNNHFPKYPFYPKICIVYYMKTQLFYVTHLILLFDNWSKIKIEDFLCLGSFQALRVFGADGAGPRMKPRNKPVCQGQDEDQVHGEWASSEPASDDQAGPQWSARVTSGSQSVGQDLYEQGMARAELQQALQQHRSSRGEVPGLNLYGLPGPEAGQAEWRVIKSN